MFINLLQWCGGMPGVAGIISAKHVTFLINILLACSLFYLLGKFSTMQYKLPKYNAKLRLIDSLARYVGYKTV